MTTAESNMPLTASRAHNESPPQTVSPSDELKNAQSRYLAGEPRGRVFRDLVVNSIAQSRRNSRPSILDIGCGHGFMGDTSLQHSIISQGAHAVGIEPDAEIEVSQVFTEVHRTTFELAPLASGSIDVAYATFVLEHVSDPARFWGKLYECLAPGGVFWGFTVDARHPFCFASQTMQKLRIKDTYLEWLKGRRGKDRYENYPTYYRANSPRQLRRSAAQFSRCDSISLHRVGQLKYYFPRKLRPLSRLFDRVGMALHLPGSMLVVRIEK